MPRSKRLSSLRDKIEYPYAMRLEGCMFLSSMFTKKTIRKNFLWFLFLSVFLLNIADLARADCSCTTGGGITNIGIEAVGSTCPPEPPSDNHEYYYVMNNIDCLGGISYVAPWGADYWTPANLQNFWVGYGYRILRNPSGSHMIIVNPSYTGTVAGKNMNNLPAGVYETVPPEALNQYCTPTSPSPSDQDSDGFPDCLDCIPNDPTNGGSCISTPNNLGQCFD